MAAALLHSSPHDLGAMAQRLEGDRVMFRFRLVSGCRRAGGGRAAAQQPPQPGRHGAAPGQRAAAVRSVLLQ